MWGKEVVRRMSDGVTSGTPAEKGWEPLQYTFMTVFCIDFLYALGLGAFEEFLVVMGIFPPL